jgi:hypothetical protein
MNGAQGCGSFVSFADNPQPLLGDAVGRHQQRLSDCRRLPRSPYVASTCLLPVSYLSRTGGVCMLVGNRPILKDSPLAEPGMHYIE